MNLDFIRTDGGRMDAGFKGDAGDCVTRALALAFNQGYRQTYRELTELSVEMSGGLDRSVRHGVYPPVYHRYITERGWEVYVCKPKTYLNALASVSGNFIAVIPRHVAYVSDGVVMDTWDSRKSKRTKCGSPTLIGYYYEA